MGQPGDLVLVFADALTRSWKQIIKFTPEGEMPRPAAKVELPSLEQTLDERVVAAMGGVVREERGLVFEREASDSAIGMNTAPDPAAEPYANSRPLTGRNLPLPA